MTAFFPKTLEVMPWQRHLNAAGITPENNPIQAMVHEAIAAATGGWAACRHVTTSRATCARNGSENMVGYILPREVGEWMGKWFESLEPMAWPQPFTLERSDFRLEEAEAEVRKEKNAGWGGQSQ